MKKYILLLIVSFFTINLFAQGKTLAEVLPTISSISVEGDLTVTLIKSDLNRLEGTIPEDQLDHFSWSVTDSCNLVITLKSAINLGNNLPLSPINLKVYFTDLKDIKSKKNCRIISNDTIESRLFTIDASRNSVVSVPLKCYDLTAYCSSSAVLNLRGTCNYVVLESSGGGNVNGRELETENTTVTASTTAEVHVKATKKLLLTAKTKAIIYYKKSDAVVTKSEKSLGKVVEYE